MDMHQFAKFQVDSIAQLGRDFVSDFLTVNILHLNDKFLLDGDITSAVAYTDEKTIESYQRALIHDTFTPLTFLNSGSALFLEATNSMDYWCDQTIFKEHCTPYEQYWILGVSYQYPHHKTTFIAFDYIRAKGEPFSSDLTEEYVEYVSYPFYLAWLHIHGAICGETLRGWLALCAGMTQARFTVLRAMAGQGITKAAELGGLLNLAQGTIHRHTENAYEALLSSGVELIDSTGNANRVLELTRQYQFFNYGMGNVARKLPRRALRV
jgi:hypothetical protein